MTRRAWSWLLLALGLGVAACGDDDDGPGGAGGSGGTGGSSGDIGYAAPGSLSLPAGKGSFRFGVASAATQIEDQNPNTDWYTFTRRPLDGDPPGTKALGKGKAFVGEASRGYTKALDDIKLITDLHLDSYRLSLEWARIEPARDQIDEAAIAHYRAVLEGLKAAGVRPIVTVHHFSNPMWIDSPLDITCASGPSDTNLCGLGHPQGGPLVIAEMAQHARLLAERFGDLVDDWGTLNEPVNYLLASHLIGSFPPGKSTLGDILGQFIPVVRDYVEAHAQMYQAIKQADTVDADGDGQAAAVGLSLSVADWVPSHDNVLSDDPLDVTARDRVIYVYHHLLVDSLRAGSFDKDLDGTLDEDHPSWKGTLDWLGVQYYFRAGVTGHDGLLPVLNLTPCFGTFDFGACVPPLDVSTCVPAMHYEYSAPGLYTVLKDMGTRYPDLPLLVSEAGIATEVGKRRAENVVRTLEQIDRARAEGIDVRGYYHWSLFDNFEWADGFAPRFGLYKVDYSTYDRTPTEGATVLGQIAGGRKLTAENRALYGGSGPMTPEDDKVREDCTE